MGVVIRYLVTVFVEPGAQSSARHQKRLADRHFPFGRSYGVSRGFDATSAAFQSFGSAV